MGAWFASRGLEFAVGVIQEELATFSNHGSACCGFHVLKIAFVADAAAKFWGNAEFAKSIVQPVHKHLEENGWRSCAWLRSATEPLVRHWTTLGFLPRLVNDKHPTPSALQISVLASSHRKRQAWVLHEDGRLVATCPRAGYFWKQALTAPGLCAEPDLQDGADVAAAGRRACFLHQSQDGLATKKPQIFKHVFVPMPAELRRRSEKEEVEVGGGNRSCARCGDPLAFGHDDCSGSWGAWAAVKTVRGVMHGGCVTTRCNAHPCVKDPYQVGC